MQIFLKKNFCIILAQSEAIQEKDRTRGLQHGAAARPGSHPRGSEFSEYSEFSEAFDDTGQKVSGRLRGRGLFRGVGEDGGALYVDAIFFGAGEDGSGEAGAKLLGAVAEVGFGGAYVGGVGHGVFPSFGEAEDAVGELLLLLISEAVGWVGHGGRGVLEV